MSVSERISSHTLHQPTLVQADYMYLPCMHAAHGSATCVHGCHGSVFLAADGLASSTARAGSGVGPLSQSKLWQQMRWDLIGSTHVLITAISLASESGSRAEDNNLEAEYRSVSNSHEHGIQGRPT